MKERYTTYDESPAVKANGTVKPSAMPSTALSRYSLDGEYRSFCFLRGGVSGILIMASSPGRILISGNMCPVGEPARVVEDDGLESIFVSYGPLKRLGSDPKLL